MAWQEDYIDNSLGHKPYKEPIDLEITSPGHANGISIQLYQKRNPIFNDKNPIPDSFELTPADLEQIVDEAAEHFGRFLTALGCNWKRDPNSRDTPRRVAKAYVYDLWKGRYEEPPSITAFPSDGYTGLVVESNIPLTSMCSHHHSLISGFVTIAYVPSENGKVVGLSKLNRIVEHFGRRGAIQEQLTVAIHSAIDKLCEDNLGVAVSIDATHACVMCRGVKHQGASMQTTKLTGCFLEEDSARSEFMMHVNNSVTKRFSH